MKRMALVAVIVMIPFAVFAQAKEQSPQQRSLQRLGLTDEQISQVLEVQTKTMDTLRQDAAQVRVLRAQIDRAMLASTVDLNAVNGLVDQLSQQRASMQKTALAARAKLQQIMGVDTYFKYLRGVRREFARSFRERHPWFRLQPWRDGAPRA